MGVAWGRRCRRWVKLVLVAVLAAAGIGVAGIVWLRSTPLERGRAAYREGRWRDALNLANERLKADSNDREALRLSARSSARLQRDQATVAMYVRLGSENAQAEDF